MGAAARSLEEAEAVLAADADALGARADKLPHLDLAGTYTRNLKRPVMFLPADMAAAFGGFLLMLASLLVLASCSKEPFEDLDLLLDIKPGELTEAERAKGLGLDDQVVANRLARTGLERALELLGIDLLLGQKVAHERAYVPREQPLGQFRHHGPGHLRLGDVADRHQILLEAKERHVGAGRVVVVGHVVASVLGVGGPRVAQLDLPRLTTTSASLTTSAGLGFEPDEGVISRYRV